ncbi:hypothetical protein N9B82_05885 [Saprospiraceae bacterium]|nr:hypothetical protein [Saprospiraceae bacterium]
MKYLLFSLSLLFTIGLVSCDKFDLDKKKEAKKESKKDKNDYKKECFELLLAVTYDMPDGSSLAIETEADWTILKNWYEDNKEAEEKPVLIYPVDIKYGDGTIVSVSDDDEMEMLKKDCE